MSAEPYDPYIPNSGNTGEPPSKTKQVQAKIDEVVNIMQENIDHVVGRGERLDDLQGKTEDLSNTSARFRRGANEVRKRMWWKDMKMRIIIAVAILILLAIIISISHRY